MNAVRVCFKLDVEKVLENGALVRSLRLIKLAADELNFRCVEPYVWEYRGSKSQEYVSLRLLNLRIRQYDVMERLEKFSVRYPDGKTEDYLKEYKDFKEKMSKKGVDITKERLFDLEDNSMVKPKTKKK